MKNNKIYILLGISLFISVAVSGCLVDNSGERWEHEVDAIINVTGFTSGAPENVPAGENLIQYTYNALPKDPHYNSIQALWRADFLITARVTEIKPSVWSTPDGKMPAEIAGRLTYIDENGTVQTRNEISGDGYIYTVVRFEKLEDKPEKAPEQFDVKIYGGQVDNIVMAGSVGFPNAWDLEVGKLYHVMIQEGKDGEYILVPSSLANAHYRRTESVANSPELNPENAYLVRYLTSDVNVPTGQDIEYYHDILMFEPIVYSDEELISKADLAFYGTVKKVNPSVWSTSDGKDPDNSSFYQQHPEAEVGKGAEFIYTTFVFEIDNLVKGNASDDVTVFVRGGQEGKYVQHDLVYYPTIWDIQEGDTYLVYLKEKPNHDNYDYEIMYGGLFISDFS